MAFDELKYTPPFGAACIESTADEKSRTTDIEATPLRSAVSLISRISPVLFAPKNNAPSASAMPQLSQNARPVGAIVGVNQRSGMIRGSGPSWFVLSGALPEQVSCGPHAWFSPASSTLISSTHSGPFSVSHNVPDSGSK